MHGRIGLHQHQPMHMPPSLMSSPYQQHQQQQLQQHQQQMMMANYAHPNGVAGQAPGSNNSQST